MVFEYERVRCVVGEAEERCCMISNFWSLKKKSSNRKMMSILRHYTKHSVHNFCNAKHF